MTGEPVYLDYAATTPLEPRVARFLGELFALPPGNAGALHAGGRRAAAVVEAARAQVAGLLGAGAADIVFTSGATEANNLAILGFVRGLPRPTGGALPQVVTLATEHKAVLEPVRRLERERVATATVLVPGRDGLLDPAALRAALTPQAALVTLLHANNETGVAQDLAAVRAVCAEAGVALHVDAAQSAGKLPLDVAGIDFVSVSGHKLGAPAGVGALYVAPHRRASLVPLQSGGGQERGLRAGTLPVQLVGAFGLACELAGREREAWAARVGALRERLWSHLAALPGALQNGHPSRRVAGILSVSFEGVEGEALLAAVPGLAVSTGSACNSATGEPSYVLRALGRDTELAQASLRFSLGWGSTEADVDTAADAVIAAVTGLRARSPARPAPVDDWVDAGARVARGEAGAVRLGTWVRWLLRLEGRGVAEARVQSYGCPHVAAACELLRGRLPGQPWAAADVGTPEDWRVAVRGPVEKLGRMLIIEDALRAALRDAANLTGGVSDPPWPSR